MKANCGATGKTYSQREIDRGSRPGPVTRGRQQAILAMQRINRKRLASTSVINAHHQGFSRGSSVLRLPWQLVV